MVNAELIFEAYLNAAIPYIDMKWLADPINHLWRLFVRNQSNQTLYFKLFNAIPNWDFGTSLPGSDEKELGAIGAGGSGYYNIDMVREVPVGEIYDDGNFTLKAYTDAGYSNEIASADKFVTIDIQDIENWTDVTIHDFDDGTVQGWSMTRFVLSQVKSVEAGGWSMYADDYVQTWEAMFLSKSLSIPNRNKCSLGFFYHTAEPLNLSVSLDAETVFYVPGLPSTGTNWWKVVVNLSPYRGQTKTIKVDFSVTIAVNPKLAVDRIVLAGKD